MDEKKVELTDEEIAKEIVKSLVNTKKSLEDLHEDDDDYDKLSLIQQINNSSLWLIQRLQDENEKLKTLVSHFEQLEKQLTAEIKRLTREKSEDVFNLLDLYEKAEADIHSMEREADGYRETIAELQKQVDELKAYAEDIYKKAVDREEDAYSLGFDKGKEQAVKDTAKEIYKMADEIATGSQNDGANILSAIKERYGVEVE